VVNNMEAVTATDAPLIPTGTPSVSVIINNHNYGRFLDAAISSALHQRDASVQVIVVDDGSTDHSRQVIERYGDQILAVFKPNGGQASALNAGFARSSGRFVIFLDADDVLLPDTAAQVVRAFRGEPRPAKVQYRMHVIDGLGKRTGAIKPPPHVPLLDGDLRRHYLRFPDDVWRMPTSGNAFPGAVLRALMPIPEDQYHGGADTYLTHLAPLFGPVRSLHEVGACYRVHGDNNYETAVPLLNLARVRRNVTHARQTHAHIRHAAVRLGLCGPTEPASAILSVSDIANRLMSLRLDAEHHPLPTDSVHTLVLLGARAALGRFDVSPAMRGLYIAWFVAMGLAPRSLADWLARQMAFPQARGRINRLLGILERHRMGGMSGLEP
jgi:hypothetical protein